MNAIFTISKSAVMLNGVPGLWIDCKHGLRQADPLSTYLFILVADVLQQMIKQDPELSHPLVKNAPCLVMQYTDDTLILVSASAHAAVRHKQILEDFSHAVGAGDQLP